MIPTLFQALRRWSGPLRWRPHRYHVWRGQIMSNCLQCMNELRSVSTPAEMAELHNRVWEALKPPSSTVTAGQLGAHSDRVIGTSGEDQSGRRT